MSIKGKKIISNISIILGAILIIAAAGLLFYNIRGYDVDVNKAIASIEKHLPTIVETVPQEKGNNIMPSMEIDGESYIALIEMDAYNFKMPVRSVYDEKAIKEVPCRYDGSVYNDSLVIASVDEEGQMDFINNVNTGDKLTVIDMNGERFTYKVVKIDNSNTISKEVLCDGGYDLTLFVEYSGYTDYLLVRFDIDFAGAAAH